MGNAIRVELVLHGLIVKFVQINCVCSVTMVSFKHANRELITTLLRMKRDCTED